MFRVEFVANSGDDPFIRFYAVISRSMSKACPMPHEILSVDNGSVREDGQSVKFEIQTTNGETLPFEMPARDIVKFVAFLCTLGQFAATKSGADVSPLPESFEGPLIETSHVGLAQGRTPEEIVMALQVGQFALGVAIPNDKLEFLRALFLHSSSAEIGPN
jgi:hypothetical protein